MDRSWAFDAVDTPLILADAAGTVRAANRPALALGHDLVGQPLSQRGEPFRTAATLLGRVERGGSVEGQVEEGGVSWSVRVSWPDADDAPRVVQVRDISLLVALQDGQRRMERLGALGALVRVAHQVRNPLAAIVAAVDTFEARFGRQPDQQRYFEILRHSAGRMTQLMQELLDYAKPAAAAMREGGVVEVLDAALRSSAALAEQAGVALDRRVAADLPRLRRDPAQLVQVFENLIENALQHSPRGTRVTVEARRTERAGSTWVECLVSDAGPGLRDIDLERVFEPFFTRRPTGTGLGLAIAERIVERHGGTIRAENAPGGGALFRVLLPGLATS